MESNQKCRSCLRETHEMLSVFDKVSGNDELILAELIKIFLNYEIKEDDKSYTHFCSSCAMVLINFYDFKMKFERSQKYIKYLSDSDDDVKDVDLVTTTEEIETASVSDIADNDDADSGSNEDIKVPDFIDPAVVLKEEDTQIAVGSINLNNSEILIDEIRFIKSSPNSGEEIKEYVCKICGTVFAEALVLLRHKELKHFDKDLSNGNANKIEFEEITFSDGEKKYKCLLCSAHFAKKKYLTEHKIVHTTERNFKCPFCDKLFKTRKLANCHQKIHTNPQRFVCEQCGRGFNQRSTMQTHIQLLHEKSRNHMCSVCGLKFSLKSTLNLHTRRRHTQKPEDYVSCPQCHIRYKNKCSLRRHYNIVHLGQQPIFQCEACPKSYRSKTKLNMHKVKKHTQGTENYYMD